MEIFRLAELLLQRLNHLEDVLVTSLFSITITATLTVFGVFFYRSANHNLAVPHIPFLIGVNVLYIFLSSFYYYMLTHFYAVAAILIEHAKQYIQVVHLDYFWSFFEISGIPFLEDSTKNTFYLALAPAFPFLFSVFVGIALLYCMKEHEKIYRISMTFFLIHLLVMYAMVWAPFQKFLGVLGK